MKCGFFGYPLLVCLFSVFLGFHLNIFASLPFTLFHCHSLLSHHLNPCQCRHKLWFWQPPSTLSQRGFLLLIRVVSLTLGHVFSDLRIIGSISSSKRQNGFRLDLYPKIKDQRNVFLNAWYTYILFCVLGDKWIQEIQQLVSEPPIFHQKLLLNQKQNLEAPFRPDLVAITATSFSAWCRGMEDAIASACLGAVQAHHCSVFRHH